MEWLPESCPCCHGDGIVLGALGKRVHLRCRACGIDFSMTQAEYREALQAFAASHDCEALCFTDWS